MRCPNPQCPDIEKYGIAREYPDGITECLECGATLEASPEESTDPDTQAHGTPERDEMCWLYSPRSEGELAVLSSILRWAGIRYFIHNHYFGTMRVGPELDLMNRRTFMVPTSQAEDAADVLHDFLEVSLQEQRPLSTRDRIRNVIEFLLFHWFIPGKMPSRAYRDRLDP